MKKLFCGLLLMLALTACLSCTLASVRPEGSFRLGGGGKDFPLCAPIPLEDGGLIVAVSSQGGIGGETRYPDGAYKTRLACLNADGSERRHTLWDGSMRLDGLDEDGNVRALCRFRDDEGDVCAQMNVFSADTGELMTRGASMKLISTSYDDDLHITSLELPDYLLVTEIHDPSATTEPRYVSLVAADGAELWKTEQRELNIRNIYGAEQQEDGILLFGSTYASSDGIDELPCAVKVSCDGKLLWQYTSSSVDCGGSDCCIRAEDGALALFGWGHTNLPTDDSVTYTIAAALNASDGAVLWEKAYPVGETGISARSSIAPAPQGYAYACYNSDSQTFDVACLDASCELTGAWSVPAPGFNRYFGVMPFTWNGELWVQAIADNGERYDAHYQKIGREYADGRE